MNDNDYLYSTWQKMHTRCYNSNYHSYHRYGGRGIKVCDEWQSYERFKKDMQGTWQRGLTLDRIDNDADYSWLNCRWLPKSENRKPYLVNPYNLLEEYKAGSSQKDLAKKYGTDQPHISRLLKKARNGTAL